MQTFFYFNFLFLAITDIVMYNNRDASYGVRDSGALVN